MVPFPLVQFQAVPFPTRGPAKTTIGVERDPCKRAWLISLVPFSRFPVFPFSRSCCFSKTSMNGRTEPAGLGKVSNVAIGFLV